MAKIASSSDGSLIVVGATLSKACVALTRDGRLLWRKDVEHPIDAIGMNHDGALILVGAGEGVSALDQAGGLLWYTEIGGHIRQITIAPDGELSVISNDNHKFFLLDRNGVIVGKNRFEKESIEKMAISTKGPGTESGFRLFFHLDRTVRVIDTDYAAVGGTSLEVASRATCMDISGDGNMLAYGHFEDTKDSLIVDDLKIGPDGAESGEMFKHGLASMMRCVAVSGDGLFIAGGTDDYDRSIYLFARDGLRLLQLKTRSPVEQVGLDHYASHIVATGKERSVYVIERNRRIFWDLALAEHPSVLEIAKNGSVAMVGMDTHGIIVFEPGRLVSLVETANYELNQAFQFERSGNTAVAAQIYTKLGLTGERDRCLRMSVAPLPPLADLPVFGQPAIVAMSDADILNLPTVCENCGGKLDRTGILDFCPACRRFPVTQPPLWGLLWKYRYEDSIEHLSIAPDNSYFALGTADGMLSSVDFTGALLWRRDGGMKFIAISPQSNLILTSYEGGLRLFDRAGHLHWERFLDHRIHSGALSRDLSIIMAASPNHIWYYNIKGDEISDIKAHSFHSAFMNSDGKVIVANLGHNFATNRIFGYDLNGNRLWWFALRPMSQVREIRVSRNGRMVLVGGQNKMIVALDWDGNVLFQKKTGGEVASVESDGNDNIIVAGSLDGHIYTLRTDGRLSWKYNGGSPITKVAISDDGRLVAVITSDKNLLVLNQNGGLIRKTPISSGMGLLSIRNDGLVLFIPYNEKDIHCYAPMKAGPNVDSANTALKLASDLEDRKSTEDALRIYRNLGVSSEILRVLKKRMDELVANGKPEEASLLLTEVRSIEENLTKDAGRVIKKPKTVTIPSQEPLSKETTNTINIGRERIEEFPLDAKQEKRWNTMEKEIRSKIPTFLKRYEEHYRYWLDNIKPNPQSHDHLFVLTLAQTKLLIDEVAAAKALYGEACDAYHRFSNQSWGDDCFQVYLGKGPELASNHASRSHDWDMKCLARDLNGKIPYITPGKVVTHIGVAGNLRHFEEVNAMIRERAGSTGVHFGEYPKGLKGRDKSEAKYIALALAKSYLVDGLFRVDADEVRRGFEYWSNLEKLYWDTERPYPDRLVFEDMVVLYDIALKKGMKLKLNTPFIPRSVLENGY